MPKNSLNHSKKGFKIVDNQITELCRIKGWSRGDIRWLLLISSYLDPKNEELPIKEYDFINSRKVFNSWQDYLELEKRNLTQIEGLIYENLNGIKPKVWQKFRSSKCKSIYEKTYIACCKAIDIRWDIAAEKKKEIYLSDNFREKLVKNSDNLSIILYSKGNIDEYPEAAKMIIDNTEDYIFSVEYSSDNSNYERLESIVDFCDKIIKKNDNYNDKNILPKEFLRLLYLSRAKVKNKLDIWSGAIDDYRKFCNLSTSQQETFNYALIEESTMLMNLGNYDEAIKILNTINSNSLEIEWKALHLRGWISIYKRSNLSLDIFERNLRNEYGLDDDFSKSETYHFIGRTYFDSRQYEKALNNFKIQYKILKNLKHLEARKLGHCFRFKAKCYQHLRCNEQYLKANNYHQKDVDRLEKMCLESSEICFKKLPLLLAEGGLAHLYLHQAYINIRLRKLDVAEPLLEEAKEIWSKPNAIYRRGLEKCSSAMNLICNLKGNRSR